MASRTWAEMVASSLGGTLRSARNVRSFWNDTCWLTMVTALVYALLRQDAVHHLDMHGVVRSVVAEPGEGARYAHFGYQWLALLLHSLNPDAPLYRPLQWCSVLGAALAVGVGHRVCINLGFARGAALVAAAGAAATGTALYFATVAEMHAVFWLPANLGFLQLAHALRGGARRHWWLAGLCFGVAAAVHGSGQLLLPLALLAVWAARARWLELVWLVLAHAVSFALLRAVDAATLRFADDAATMAHYQDTLARFAGIGSITEVLWREAIVPYFPFWLAPLLGLRSAASRRIAVALLLACSGYLLVQCLLLVGLLERGAYALPLALPLAAFLTHQWGARLALAAAVLAAGSGVLPLLQQDPQRIPTPAFAAGLAEWARAHADDQYLLGGYSEIDSMLVHGAPRWHCTIMEPEYVIWLDPTRPDAAVRDSLRAAVARAAAHGGGLVLSEQAVVLFAQLPRNRAILEDAMDDLELTEVQCGALRGQRLSLRGR